MKNNDNVRLRLEKKSLADANILNFLVSLPTWEQVLEWFREKGLYSFIRVNIPDLSVSYFIYDKDGYIEENGHRNTYKDDKNDCVEELTSRQGHRGQPFQRLH